MSKPLISIIVPAYNSATTIARCVDSIKVQTCTDWELIIADNGSTDGCAALCRQLAEVDSRIRVIEVAQLGVSAARNAALDIAIGEYVCFVDSDDTLESNYLRELTNYSEYDLVVSGYWVNTVDAHGVEIQSCAKEPSSIIWQNPEQKDRLIPLFEHGYMHFCWNKLFHSSIVDGHNIRFQSAPVNEDYIFVLEYLSYAKSICVVNKPLYHWIRVKGIITSVKSIPDNLLAIYNESHAATRKFFGDDSVADRIAYFSYEMIVYKYYSARLQDRLSKGKMYSRLAELGQNIMVKAAYSAYTPKSAGERLLYMLARHRLFRLHYFVTQKIIKCQHQY